jgi:hypothetical protein
MTRHHWQCSFNADQNASECDCGLTGPRDPFIGLLPYDRAPTEAEAEAYRQVILEAETGAAHEPESTDADVLDEARFLTQAYLLADDADLAPDAIDLKRRLAGAIVKVGNEPAEGEPC